MKKNLRYASPVRFLKPTPPRPPKNGNSRFEYTNSPAWIKFIPLYLTPPLSFNGR